jgi:glyoxylase-like metal-dependent hydrolase (beta-lactamase superfamily II)
MSTTGESERESLSVAPGLPESKHFQIERLAEGVYAAIASEQGYAICNAGIIDIGDRTILFDTFISPEAARDLLKVTEQLTSHKITHVVNSHGHNDHIRGNQVFGSGIDIISTVKTREAIARNEPEEIKSERETIPKEIIEAHAKLATEKDPKRRRELASLIVYLQVMIKSHSELKTRLPNITFEHKLTIHGTKRTVELLPLAGHTASDIVLYLPEDKIAFMGDLLFVECHPYLASGSPEQWKQSLAEVEGLGVQIAVPGHGPVGRSASLSMMLQYIQSLESIVANMIKSGKPVEQASLEPVPPPFDTWLSPDNFFVTNLEFLYKLATIIRDEETHRKLLSKMKKILVGKEKQTEDIAPAFKYQNPNAWSRAMPDSVYENVR